MLQRENIKYHNPKWSLIFDHPYRISIVGGSGSGKTSTFLNLTKQQNDDDYNIIDKIYLYVQDPNEAKYQYLIKKHKKLVLKSVKIQRQSLNIHII